MALGLSRGLHQWQSTLAVDVWFKHALVLLVFACIRPLRFFADTFLLYDVGDFSDPERVVHLTSASPMSTLERLIYTTYHPRQGHWPDTDGGESLYNVADVPQRFGFCTEDIVMELDAIG